MSPETSDRPVRNTIGLLLWLISGMAIAGIYTFAHLAGIGRFGLGWAVRPGFVVLFLIIAIAVMESRNLQLRNIIQIALCFLAAILLEYAPVPRLAGSFIGIALTLSGATILFNSAARIRLPEMMQLLVGSYIQSVCIYNIFRGEQMMFFFKPGWTF